MKTFAKVVAPGSQPSAATKATSPPRFAIRANRLSYAPHASEMTGPVYGHGTVAESENDLTRQGAGEPLGERIIVSGRVLDEGGPADSRHAGGSLAGECGRALSACGRRSSGSARPNFVGAGRTLTDANGVYRFTTIKPGPLSVAQPLQRLAAGAHHFSLFGTAFSFATGDADVSAG